MLLCNNTTGADVTLELALLSNTTGERNTAVGSSSFRSKYNWNGNTDNNT